MTTGDCLCMKRGGRPVLFFNEEMYYKTSVLFYDNKKNTGIQMFEKRKSVSS